MRHLLLITAAAMLLAGCHDAARPQPAAATQPSPQARQAVTIDNFTFDPPVATVTAGTTVTWTNHDDVPHTVTSADKPRAFKSDALDTDDTYSHVFTQPGTYPYFCAVHPHMTGRIVVTGTLTKE
jgi:plastocyanin